MKRVQLWINVFDSVCLGAGTVIPMEFITYTSELPNDILFSPVTSIASIVILFVILTVVFITICYYRRKRKFLRVLARGYREKVMKC